MEYLPEQLVQKKSGIIPEVVNKSGKARIPLQAGQQMKFRLFAFMIFKVKI
jgi:hypothetical protein